MFLIGAIRNLWEIRCFYFHLKEDCMAGDERILRVKRALQRMQGMSLRLMNLISWCSPLGPVFLKLRNTKQGSESPKPGYETMSKLENAGIRSANDLRSCTIERLLQIGLRKNIAHQIIGYLRRS